MFTRVYELRSIAGNPNAVALVASRSTKTKLIASVAVVPLTAIGATVVGIIAWDRLIPVRDKIENLRKKK